MKFSYLGFLLKNKFKLNFLNKVFFMFFMFFLLCFLMYLQYFYKYMYSMKNYYMININFLGYSLFITGIVSALFIFWLADVKIFFNKFFTLFIFLFFFVLIWLFINEKSYLNLFMIYEFFLLPSFFLIYYMSPNRSSTTVSIYFLTWTQTGSMFVLLGILYMYINTKSMYLTYNNTLNYNFLFVLLFLGFGMKMPMWPFYYWLTKTHVEASSFFSMYLSGFLVKTAVYLFNHFYSYFYNIYFMNFLFVMVLMGVMDSSIKMWHQMDLKKLMAYTTVQEMNLLFMPMLWNNEFSLMLTSFFMIVHCFLSSLFFFIIDLLLKKYNTSMSTQITGIMHTTPLFGCFMFMSLILFSGIPFTSKFYIEILMFNIFKNYNLNLFLSVFMICNWIGLIGLSKNFFNILFGQPINHKMTYDLTKKEIFIFLFVFINLFLMSYLSYYTF